MEQASLFSINWKDVVNSLVLGFITVVGGGLVSLLDAGTLPTFDSVKSLLLLGVTTSIANLLRKYFTNSNNTFATPEPPKQ